MRWEALFADMEAQLERARREGEHHEVADLARAERANVPWTDRVRASRGCELRVHVGEGEPLRGVLVDVAAHWLLLAQSARQVLVPVTAVVAVEGLTVQAAPAAGAVERRLGLGHALRALARDRAPVVVHARGLVVAGRVDRVGADHLDLTVADGARGGSSVAVPFASLIAVRSG